MRSMRTNGASKNRDSCCCCCCCNWSFLFLLVLVFVIFCFFLFLSVSFCFFLFLIPTVCTPTVCTPTACTPMACTPTACTPWIFYDIYFTFLSYGQRLRPTAKCRSFSWLNIRLRPKVKIAPTVQHWIGAQNVNALKVYYGTFNVFVLSIIRRKHSIMGDQHYVRKDFFWKFCSKGHMKLCLEGHLNM